LILRREHVGVTHQLQAPVDAFLRALDAAAPSVSFPESPWHAHCRQLKSTLSVFDEPHPTTAGALNYYDVIAALNAHLQGGETIVADAGSAYYIVGQAIRPKARTRVILAGGLAQMGYTTGAAIGAAFAAPDRTIIGVTGDGSFQMNVHDLAVMHHHRLNIKLVVVNNGGYVCIRNTQHAYFGGLLSGVDEQTGVSFPDLEQLASAYGVPYARACSNAELEAALTGALSTRGPLLLEAKVVREQEILPSVQSQRRPDGTMASKPLHEMYPFLPDERTAELLMRD
jgi:acetolactate synthase-1/2/3 large subunit